MRRMIAVLVAGTMALCAGGCASNSQEAYEFAERCFGLGEYETAAEYFMQLGEYRDSAEYLLYADALLALEEGDIELAKANLQLIVPFKSAERYLQCIRGIELEEAGEYASALEIFRQLGTFAGCDRRAARLENETPEREREACRELMKKGDYESAVAKLREMEKSTETARLIAECETALEKMAYQAACALQEEGKTMEAMNAFMALGEVQDAPAKLAECRSELYTGAVRTEVTLQTIMQLTETYAALGDYLDSAERLAELQLRNRCSTTVCVEDWVSMGADDAGEVVLWRVEDVQENMVQVSGEVAGEIAWSAAEKAALADIEFGRRNVEPLFTVRKRNDKPFSDSVPVSVTGTRSVTAMIDLTGAPFTQGDGSKEAPYRVGN